MTKNAGGGVPAVIQFFGYLTPAIVNAFLLVYLLLGFVLEGEAKLRWTDEAADVGFAVGGLVVLFALLVLVYLWWRGVGRQHMLWISSIAHGALAISFYLVILMLR